jgi:DNA-binding NtrC family response regulator
LKKMKILVVDDEEIVLNSCQRVLCAEGFEVILMDSAERVPEIIGEENPVLLLVDIKMPGGSGFSLMEEIRGKKPDLPVVIMSGYSTPATISEAVKKGAAGFLPKPFTPDELIDIIRQAISGEKGEVKGEKADR